MRASSFGGGPVDAFRDVVLAAAAVFVFVSGPVDTFCDVELAAAAVFAFVFAAFVVVGVVVVVS